MQIPANWLQDERSCGKGPRPVPTRDGKHALRRASEHFLVSQGQDGRMHLLLITSSLQGPAVPWGRKDSSGTGLPADTGNGDGASSKSVGPIFLPFLPLSSAQLVASSGLAALGEGMVEGDPPHTHTLEYTIACHRHPLSSNGPRWGLSFSNCVLNPSHFKIP